MAVAGAAVTVRNTDTTIARETQTNSDGYFVAPLLPRGAYEVAVRYTGFKPILRSNLNLDEGQVLRVDFELQVGDVKDAIEVSATAPALEKDTGMMSTVISSQEIEQLPMLDANIIGLTALVPTVRPLNGAAFDSLPISSSSAGRMSIAGGPPGSNNYQIDGIAAENAATGNMSVFLMPDSVQEFRVIARNPSAEFGRTGGGAVLVISKSGTNQFHGSAYEYLRNTKLNANAFFTNRAGLSRADTKINQWGATFGGPLIRQKTFFFANYDGIEQRAEGEVTRSVPTAAQRTGDFQGTQDTLNRQVAIYDPLTTRAEASGYTRDPFPSNTIPADRISPIARAILRYLPMPTQAGIGATGGNNFYARGSTPTTKRVYGIKVDHNFNANRRISVRYTHDTSFLWVGPSYYGPIAENNANQGTLPRLSTALNFTNVLRPNLLLELRAGMNQYSIRNVLPPEGEGFGISTLGFPAALQAQMQLLMFPSISIANMTAFGPSSSPYRQGNYQHTYGGSLTHVFGTHTMKYGAEFRMYQVNNTQRNNVPMALSFSAGFTQGPNPNLSGTNVGSGMATFLLGFPSSGTGSISAASTYTIKHGGFFAQDDWKVTPRLTLNLGLRWEIEGPYTDRYNAMTNFDPQAKYTVSGISLVGGLTYPGTNGLPRGVRDVSMRDFQPRFGFGYHLFRKTVVHGGYGLFFLPTTGNNITLGRSGFDMNTTLIATDAGVVGGFLPVATLANPFPKGLAPALGAAGGPASGVGTAVSGTARWLRRGYVHQFNFEIQQELPSNTMLGVGYAANRGTGLQAARSYDYVPFSVRQQYTAPQLQAPTPNPYCGLMQPGLICTANTTLYGLLDAYPQFTSATVLDNWPDSIYHALTVKVTRRFTKSLTMLVSYAFSKLLDNNSGNGTVNLADGGSGSVQDWDNLRLERAVSQLNAPHRVVATVLYNVPLGKTGPAPIRALIGKWQINAIVSQWSGDPIGVSISSGARLYAGSRPNLIGDPKPSDQSIDHWLNPAAFTVSAERSPGNAPRNLSRVLTDWRKDLTLSLLKNFQVTERWKLQFRAAANNLTNTPVFGQPGTGLGSSNFGVVASTVNSPRRVQFGLKLLF
jgi:hypothetical protein